MTEEDVSKGPKNWHDQLRDYREEKKVESGEWNKFLKEYYKIDNEYELAKGLNSDKYRSPNEDEEFANHLESDFEFWKSGGIKKGEIKPQIKWQTERVVTPDDLVRGQRKKEQRAGAQIRKSIARAFENIARDDKEYINLTLNNDKLYKFTTPEERETIERGWDFLTHPESGNLSWVGFELSKNKKELSGFTIVGKEGWEKRITIPLYILRAVVRNASLGEEEGLELSVPDGMHETITAKTDLSKVVEIMKKVKFDGVKLPEDVKFFIGTDFQREKTS